MSGESDITLGELVRAVGALVAQVDKLSDKIDGSRADFVARFDSLGETYVRKDLHARDLSELNTRQDSYQKQTDQMLRGAEEEVRAVRHQLEENETARATALDKVATQRHNDRYLIGLAVTTALILPLLVITLANLWHLT